MLKILKQVQCDQIGRILKVIGDNFSYKSSTIFWVFCASFENITF